MNTTTTPDHELPIGACAECGKTFRQVRSSQRFCIKTRCRQKWYRRHEVRGGRLYRMLYRMRRDRHLPADQQLVSLGTVTRLVDQFIRDDTEQGRLSP